MSKRISTGNNTSDNRVSKAVQLVYVSSTFPHQRRFHRSTSDACRFDQTNCQHRQRFDRESTRFRERTYSSLISCTSLSVRSLVVKKSRYVKICSEYSIHMSKSLVQITVSHRRIVHFESNSSANVRASVSPLSDHSRQLEGYTRHHADIVFLSCDKNFSTTRVTT